MREAHKSSRRKWMKENREHVNAWRRDYRAKNGKRIRASEAAKGKSTRIDGITAYGGRCACCGESRIEFLTLDHINGRSPEDRDGPREWNRLKRLGWPKDNYQLLCFNCNCAKGIYGQCPHISEVAQ